MKFLFSLSAKHFFLSVIIILVSTCVLAKNVWLLSDELSYYRSIRELARGTIRNQTFTGFSVLPGYVLLNAAIIHFFGLGYASDRILIPILRTISGTISFFTVYIFFLLAKKITTHGVSTPWVKKTLQFFLSPIIFPFFFLIYTDVFSLLLNVISFYFVLRKQYTRAGLISFISIFIRQDNIFWILFYCIYIYMDKKIDFRQKKSLITYLESITIYSFSFFSLLVLLILNKGNVAIGFTNAHPVSFHLGNIYFFLVILFLLFLPLHLSHAHKIIRYVQQKPIITAFIAIALLPFFSFHIDHPNNQLLGTGTYFLRNDLLHLLLLNTQARIITFFIMIWTILSVINTKFYKKIYYSVYPCIFLALSAAWLIEQRYYIVPVTFFILFKKEESIYVTLATLIYYIFLTAIITTGIFKRSFFL